MEHIINFKMKNYFITASSWLRGICWQITLLVVLCDSLHILCACYFNIFPDKIAIYTHTHTGMYFLECRVLSCNRNMWYRMPILFGVFGCSSPCMFVIHWFPYNNPSLLLLILNKQYAFTVIERKKPIDFWNPNYYCQSNCYYETNFHC